MLRLIMNSIMRRRRETPNILKAKEAPDMAGFEPELRMLAALPADGGFIDIGANIGQWSRIAAQIFPRVFAFEPDLHLAEHLRATMPPNVTVYPVAISNRQGVGTLSIPLVRGHEELKSRASLEMGVNPGFDGEVSRQVLTVPLDEHQFSNVAVIKIDVEGHEGQAIDGAQETIEREHPILIVEIEDRHHPNQSYPIFDRILRLGYVCCYIDDDSKCIRAFERGALERLQPTGVVPPIGLKPAGYVNNFIFLPFEQVHIKQRIADHLGVVDLANF